MTASGDPGSNRRDDTASQTPPHSIKKGVRVLASIVAFAWLIGGIALLAQCNAG